MQGKELKMEGKNQQIASKRVRLGEKLIPKVWGGGGCPMSIFHVQNAKYITPGIFRYFSYERLPVLAAERYPTSGPPADADSKHYEHRGKIISSFAALIYFFK